MNLTNDQKRVIMQIINVFETGVPQGKYGKIVIFKDGPHNIRQITYGRSQTTEYGNLAELIRDYVAANGVFSVELAPYVDDIGKVPLTDDATFKTLLRRAGREDPVMRRVQDSFFDKRYFRPAMKWADRHEFTHPLSALVIYDSFIHSGSILWLIRRKFDEAPPSDDGAEKAWIRAYTYARQNWLANHHRPIVRKTIYRTKVFKTEIGRNNWDLSMRPINANGTPVS